MLDLTEYVRLEVDVPAADTNLVLNPHGALGTWFWQTLVGGTMTATDGQLTYTKQAGANNYVISDYMPLDPNKYVGSRADITALFGTCGVRAEFKFYDINKSLLSTTAKSSTQSTLGTLTHGGYQAPAQTAYVRVLYYLFETDGTTHATTGDAFSFNNAMVTWRDTNLFESVRTNLVTNPSFETNLTGWTRSNALAAHGISRDTSSGHAGSACVLFTKDVDLLESAELAVIGGETYNLSAYLRRPVSGTASMRWMVRWFDSDHASAGQTGWHDFDQSSTTWTRQSITVSAPSDAAYAVLRFLNDSSVDVQLDAILFEAADSLGGYFDGATTNTGDLSYTWNGTAHDSTSRETKGSIAFVEPGNWLNLFGDSSSLSIERKALDVGLMSATIETDVPVELGTLTNGQPIRVRVKNDGEWHNIYVGTITDWNISYVPTTRVDIQAADAIYRLASKAESKGVALCSELPYLLETVGVPWNIDGSGNQVTGVSQVSSTPNATVLDQIALTRDSRNAWAAVNRDGVLDIRDTLAQANSGVTFTDNDTGSDTELAYKPDIQIGESSDRVINHIMVKYLRYNTNTKTTTEVVYGPYTDNASIETYGPRSAEFVVHGITETAVTTWANDTLTKSKDTQPMPSTLTVPVRIERDLNVYALDLNHLATVEYKNFTGQFAVTSIKHDIQPGRWNVTFGFDKENGVASPTVKPVVKPNYASDTPYSERYRNTTQAIAASTWEKVNFATVETVGGTNQENDITYASSQYTIGRAGRYSIDSSIAWAQHATGRREMRITAGNRSWKTTDKTQDMADQSQHLSKKVRLSTGDTIFVEAWQNSGGSLNVVNGREKTNINVTWIGD